MSSKKQAIYYVFAFIILISISSLCAQDTLINVSQEKLFDPDFKEQYSGRKYNYEGKRIVNNSKTGSGDYTKYKDGERNPEIDEEDNRNSIGFGNSARILNWFFILALIAAVFYLVYILLGEENLGLFKRNGNQEIGVPDNFTAENIADTDVKSLIELAENSNDYRLAIRYYYILVLKNLSIKNYIKLEEDKTNAEYFNELKSQDFSENFAYTSYLYNYIWYGEFIINSEEYGKAKGNFIHLIKKIER